MAINSIVSGLDNGATAFESRSGDAHLSILQDIISQHIHGGCRFSSVTQGLLGSSDDARESLLAQKIVGVVS